MNDNHAGVVKVSLERKYQGRWRLNCISQRPGATARLVGCYKVLVLLNWLLLVSRHQLQLRSLPANIWKCNSTFCEGKTCSNILQVGREGVGFLMSKIIFNHLIVFFCKILHPYDYYCHYYSVLIFLGTRNQNCGFPLTATRNGPTPPETLTDAMVCMSGNSDW